MRGHLISEDPGGHEGRLGGIQKRETLGALPLLLEMTPCQPRKPTALVGPQLFVLAFAQAGGSVWSCNSFFFCGLTVGPVFPGLIRYSSWVPRIPENSCFPLEPKQGARRGLGGSPLLLFHSEPQVQGCMSLSLRVHPGDREHTSHSPRENPI